ncbi:hypothetical protein [Bradyrhizobium acaciae]|uniref:hypothetical protein n=1 Tax=Bradyrhizobium acaciae TaxID=2683706 RepID=UPI001E51592B|nr:hypothetical protein [Bradyrhizobium acaciae]MCC8979119.1 hypothetical protein [Bradyrhizobium acaciae]
MPLHRDIHWLGKQWAVTGHGLQLINQKQMGYYDIEAARLWEARVIEVQSKAWIDRVDFDNALEIARGKFAHLAPADLPPPSAAVASPPPPVRATPPAAPLEPTSVPSIEELLARLKSKSAAAAPVARPAEAPAPAPPKPEPPRLEPRKVEPTRAELLNPELANPPKPQLRPAALVAPEPSKPEARKSEPPKVEPIKAERLKAEPIKAELLKPETIKPEPAKPEPVKAEPAEREASRLEPSKPESSEPEPVALRSVALRSVALKPEMRQAAPAKKLQPPPLTPVITVVRRPAQPAWPVFDRKIAGSGRFVRPWRVTSTRWHGPSSGLPPRP